ncbi:MAG: glycosyltransferase family 2 protein, partial [Hyphomicrobiaceae bacterium]
MLERNRIITVIIPAFGRPAQLLGAIESVRAQRIPPAHEVEILVVDDASTPAIKLGATYRDVKIVRLARNAGPAGARKAGIEASEGEFLAFLDSDDRWLPDKLW